MSEYTLTQARQDALRAIGDNIFMIRIDYSVKNIVWILVIALNEKEARNMVIKNFNLGNTKVTAFKILNALEETIK